MLTREACPLCGSRWYKRNGHSHTGKQNHLCTVCSRAFVLTPENVVITEEQGRGLNDSYWRGSRYGGSAVSQASVCSGSYRHNSPYSLQGNLFPSISGRKPLEPLTIPSYTPRV